MPGDRQDLVATGLSAVWVTMTVALPIAGQKSPYQAWQQTIRPAIDY